MNQEIKAQWVAALRSGSYQQTRAYLNDARGFCCLGVLCDIHAQATGSAWVDFDDGEGIKAYGRTTSVLPRAVINWAGVEDHNGGQVRIGGVSAHLPGHNDAGRTFSQIADAIEAQL
jgi:hypothetical protein